MIMLATPSSLLTAALAAGVVVVIVALHKKRQFVLRKQGIPLPPGPPTSGWLVGSSVPAVNICTTFNEWANEYGPVFTIRRGSEIAIVIARANAATEIMERQGSALADRPPMIAAGDILSGGKRILLTRSGGRLRQLKKVVHAHLQPKVVEAYKDIQSDQAKALVLGLLDDPKNHRELVHRYSTSVILRVAYGRSSPTSAEDPAFVGVKQVIAHLREGMRPGAYLVDRIPWLKYVPGYGRRLKQYHNSDLEFYGEQLGHVRHAMSLGNAGPSFSRALLENVDGHRLSFDEMAYLAGSLYEAGSDTTTGAIIVMIMAAARFPDAQLRVQEELDRVVGTDRLPSWNDWDDLPQLHAFISEALRWRPIAPLGIPHRSTKDIIWRGYYIPAGTTVHGNHWAISRDPEAFPDPEKFDPQRWLHQNGQLRNDMNCYAFGFGRRVCAGMYFANRSMFIGLASLLWSFRIAERPEAPIDLTPEKGNFAGQLAPFQVKFVPRMEEAQLREIMTM